MCKKKFLFSMTIITLIGCTSCAFLPGSQNSADGYEYDVNGTKYSSKFYADYMFVDEYNIKSNQPVKVKNRELYEIDSDFDIYLGEFGSNDNKTLLCSEQDMEEASEYYSSSDNYNWYYIQGYNGRYNEEDYIEYDDVDYEIFDELVTTSQSYDPVYVKNHLDMCDLKLETSENENENYYCIYEKSTDGLLNSSWVTLYYYEGDLYYFVVSIGAKRPEDEGFYFVKLSTKTNEEFKKVFGLE